MRERIRVVAACGGGHSAAAAAAGEKTLPDQRVCLFSVNVMDVWPEDVWTSAAAGPGVRDVHDAALDEGLLRRVNAVVAARDADAEAAFDEARAEGGDARVDPRFVKLCMGLVTAQCADGTKVGIVVPRYRPGCFVELSRACGPREFGGVIASVERRLRLPQGSITAVYKSAARFKGYVPDPAAPGRRAKFAIAHVRAPNTWVLEDAVKLLRDGVMMPGGRRCTFPVYEDRIDVEQRFIDEWRLVPGGWYTLCGARIVPGPFRRLLVDVEVCVPHMGAPFLMPAPEIMAAPPLLVAALDLEVTSGKVGQFPKGVRPRDAVVCACVSVAWAGTPPPGAPTAAHVPFQRHAFVLSGACAPPAHTDTILHLFSSETELLAAVRTLLVVELGVDVVTGHNITKFDVAYAAERAERFGGVDGKGFLRFSALATCPPLLLTLKEITSAGTGANKLQLLQGIGFAYVDSYLWAKVVFKQRSNKLGDLAEAFLPPGSAGKGDVSYEEIPGLAAGGPEDVARLVTYCTQDCDLVLALLGTWDTLGDLTSQSCCLRIPMPANTLCGQQRRVRDPLMPFAHDAGMVMNGVNEPRPWTADSEDAGADRKITGGFVMNPVLGLHLGAVAVFDFTSLYPSIMRLFNLCFSTLLEGEYASDEWVARLEAAGVRVRTFHTDSGVFRFVQSVPGVVPQLLEQLTNERNRLKAIMAASVPGTPQYAAAKCGQAGRKITANATYGALAAKKGYMPCEAVAAVTCAMGRILIQAVAKFAEEELGWRLLYGDTDSIFVAMPRTEGTRRQQAEAAGRAAKAGEAAINAFLLKTYGTGLTGFVIKMVFEKMYFPFLLSSKKNYGGLLLTPAQTTDPRMAEDLGPDGPTGTIAQSGGRAGRRDVPAVLERLGDALMRTLCFHDAASTGVPVMDKFMDVLHGIVEEVVHLALPIDDYCMTKQLAAGFGKPGVAVQPHEAIVYRREHAVPGSGFTDGDRVTYVLVEQPDPMNLVRPASLPWVRPGTAAGASAADRAAAVHLSGQDAIDAALFPTRPGWGMRPAGRWAARMFGAGARGAGVHGYGDNNDEECDASDNEDNGDDGGAHKVAGHGHGHGGGGPRGVSSVSCYTSGLKGVVLGSQAREPHEVLADPHGHIINVVHTVKAIVGMVKQMMGGALPEQELEALEQYALRVQFLRAQALARRNKSGLFKHCQIVVKDSGTTTGTATGTATGTTVGATLDAAPEPIPPGALVAPDIARAVRASCPVLPHKLTHAMVELKPKDGAGGTKPVKGGMDAFVIKKVALDGWTDTASSSVQDKPKVSGKALGKAPGKAPGPLKIKPLQRRAVS